MGRDKTRWKIMHHYPWPNMSTDIEEYVKSCEVCQRANAKYTKATAELHTIPVQPEAWHQVIF